VPTTTYLPSGVKARLRTAPLGFPFFPGGHGAGPRLRTLRPVATSQRAKKCGVPAAARGLPSGEEATSHTVGGAPPHARPPPPVRRSHGRRPSLPAEAIHLPSAERSRAMTLPVWPVSTISLPISRGGAGGSMRARTDRERRRTSASASGPAAFL